MSADQTKPQQDIEKATKWNPTEPNRQQAQEIPASITGPGTYVPPGPVPQPNANPKAKP